MKKLVSLLSIVALGSSLLAANATYYASPTGLSTATCTIDDPGTIQAAINKTAAGTSWANGDTVILLPGTYDFTATATQSDSNTSGQKTYNIAAGKNYITIKSLNENPSEVIIQGGGESAGSASAFCLRNSISKVIGLTITNFYAHTGAAVNSTQYDPQTTIDKCIIVGNYGTKNGVTAYCNAYNSYFLNNTATSANGGVLSTYNSTKGLSTNCVIIGNSCYDIIRRMALKDCVISNNTASRSIVYNDSACNIHSCIFTDNTIGGYIVLRANMYDSVIKNNNATAASTVSGLGNVNTYRCLIKNNKGRYCVGENSTLKNCLIIKNHSEGGNAYGISNKTSYDNCTFISNSVSGTTILFSTLYATRNCIFYNNSPVDLQNKGNFQNVIYYKYVNSPNRTNCIRSNDPGFNFGRRPDFPWYSLKINSIARDKGLALSWTTNDLDYAMSKRLNGTVDIGCYEFWPRHGLNFMVH